MISGNFVWFWTNFMFEVTKSRKLSQRELEWKWVHQRSIITSSSIKLWKQFNFSQIRSNWTKPTSRIIAGVVVIGAIDADLVMQWDMIWLRHEKLSCSRYIVKQGPIEMTCFVCDVHVMQQRYLREVWGIHHGEMWVHWVLIIHSFSDVLSSPLYKTDYG